MESSHNRFVDGQDDGIQACDLQQLKANCQKWSLASDLRLLSHLKQFSNELLNKTEIANESINSLVHETKIHCVKVNNVINDFQMLANSQFVENRVYDEEMEDIMTSGSNAVQNDENVGNKSKDEEIVPKIKNALNIGLNFLNERFDNISKQVPQDSDDEEDQILEGLISDTSKNEFSQRLLPYIIGSEEFIKDNYVGLSCVEESPAIDLKTKVNDNNVNISNVSDSFESEFNNPIPVRNNIPHENTFIDNLSDSEEESGDIFGGIPHRVYSTNNNKRLEFSDESDSDKFSGDERNKDDSSLQTDKVIESKPTISFQDELSAALSGKKISVAETVNSENQTNRKIVSNKSEIPISLHSESSDDESESIFRIPKTKPKVEAKTKSNFSSLFDDEPNSASLFDDKTEKQSTENKVLPNVSSSKASVTASNLFDDEDDEEEDDLFGAAFSRKPPKVTQPTKPVVEKERENTKILVKESPKIDKPIIHKDGLFDDDDDDEDDDLFSGISVKKTNKTVVQNADAFKPVVKPITKPSNQTKPTSNLIGELSAALKKKNLRQSDDEDESSNEVDNNVKINPNTITEPLFDEIKSDTNSNVSNDKLFSESSSTKEESKNIPNKSDSISSEVKSDGTVMPVENQSNDDPNTPIEDDFYSTKPTVTLSNDSLKQRAILGSKRNRRPPSKKVVKLTPIIDFSEKSGPQSPDLSLVPEEKSPPVAYVRNIKPQNKPASDSITSSQNLPKPSFIKQDQKSFANSLRSPSTEEEDIFPSHSNQSISKVAEKSDTRTFGLFNDNEDNEDSLFSSSVKNNDRNNTSTTRKSIDKSGLFDSTDSEDELLASNHSNSTNHLDSNKLDSNRISSIIKSSDRDLFNTSSSTDSSLSNKSDLKIDSSKPALSLFSDSDDEDLFSAVTKSKAKSFNTKVDTIESQKDIKKDSEKSNIKPTKLDSLFSDSEDDKTDLFKKADEIKATKSKDEVKTTKPKTSKPLFDLDDDDEDIFAPKSTKVKTSNTLNASQKKTKKESESSDLFDDPLFASH